MQVYINSIRAIPNLTWGLAAILCQEEGVQNKKMEKFQGTLIWYVSWKEKIERETKQKEVSRYSEYITLRIFCIFCLI